MTIKVRNLNFSWDQRLLSEVTGDDSEFYDYSIIDNVMTREYERMYDRDLEDAYFEND